MTRPRYDRSPPGRDRAGGRPADLARALEPLGAVVVTLGVHDALGPRAADPFAAVRPGATVHLTARAVLVGPWGGDGTAPACGQCLAMRRQRLRSRSERDALETGSGPARPRAEWPRLSPYVADAVYALHAAVHGGRVGAPAGRRRTGRCPGSRLDLETLRIRTYPLLADPLCPACGPRGADAPDRSRPRPGPSPAPARYRLRRRASYPMPSRRLANPVSGVLGGGTWLNVTSPTTAPVAGSVFMRGLRRTDRRRRGAGRPTLRREPGPRPSGGAGAVRGNPPAHREHAAHRLVRGTGRRALDPRDCGFYADRDLPRRPAVSPFDPDRPIPWVYGHSLRDDRPVLVPARLVHYSARQRRPTTSSSSAPTAARSAAAWRRRSFRRCSNSIERDAFLLGWYAGAPLTEIDLRPVPGRRSARWSTGRLLGVRRARLRQPHRPGGAGRDRRSRCGATAAPGCSPSAPAPRSTRRTAVEAALWRCSPTFRTCPARSRSAGANWRRWPGTSAGCCDLKDHAQLFGLPAMAEHVRPYREPAAVRAMDDVYRAWTGRRRAGRPARDVAVLRGRVGAGRARRDRRRPDHAGAARGSGCTRSARWCPGCCRSTSAGPVSGPRTCRGCGARRGGRDCGRPTSPTPTSGMARTRSRRRRPPGSADAPVLA